MFILIFHIDIRQLHFSIFSVSFLLSNSLAFSYIAETITVCYSSQISAAILRGNAIVHLIWRDLSLLIRSSYLQLWFSLFFHCFVNSNRDHSHTATKGHITFLWSNNKYDQWTIFDNIKVCINLFTAMVPYHVVSLISTGNNFIIDSLKFVHVKICDISSLAIFYSCFLVSYFKLARTAITVYSHYMYALANRDYWFPYAKKETFWKFPVASNLHSCFENSLLFFACLFVFFFRLAFH